MRLFLQRVKTDQLAEGWKPCLILALSRCRGTLRADRRTLTIADRGVFVDHVSREAGRAAEGWMTGYGERKPPQLGWGKYPILRTALAATVALLALMCPCKSASAQRNSVDSPPISQVPVR